MTADGVLFNEKMGEHSMNHDEQARDNQFLPVLYTLYYIYNRYNNQMTFKKVLNYPQ